MVPRRMAQSGTTDQGEIALERQPAEAYPAIGKKDSFRNLRDLLVFLVTIWSAE